MSERYGYDPYGQQPQPEILGYDEYGQPIYRQEPEQGYPGYEPNAGRGGGRQQPRPRDGAGAGSGPGYDDPYGARQNYGYGYDPYGQQPQSQPQSRPQQGYQQQPYEQQGYGQQAYGQQTYEQQWVPQQPQPPQQERQRSFDPQGQAPQGYGEEAGTGTLPRQRPAQPEAPHQPPPPGAREPQAGPQGPQEPHGPQGGGGPGTEGGDSYATEQFDFVEEPSDDSEDVIDWLKFTESRTERREEAKRRGRNRVTTLIVVLVLVAAGGVGYLWYAGKLPGVAGGGGKAVSAAGQQRDVIAVHLRSTDAKTGNSTALLVNNTTAKRGSTVLLPNTLALSGEGGTTTTLAKSVEDDGATPTRDALGTLLGADIKGTWRLDTPFLENLVELVGGIAVDTDATVPGEKKGDKPQVERGSQQNLDGRAAVAYATYRAQGEQQAKQLNRFGQVMQATLRKLSSDPDGATKTVQTLGQIPDPSLSEKELGASLAKLAEEAKNGSYKTELLPARADGTLSRATSDGLVKQVLGGTVKNSDPDAALRVKLTDASRKRGNGAVASAALTNGGYTVVDGGTGGGAVRARSQVSYGKAEQKAKAEEVAKTLGLPGSAVRKGAEAGNADVTVVLGRDYKG